MLIFSDLHLREDSEDVVFGEVLPGILAAAYEREEKVIACLGDVLHFRNRVIVRLMNALRDELRGWVDLGMQVIILPGNHDQVDLEGRNALEHLDDLHHVSVYTEPRMDDHGLWIPYRKNHDHILSALNLAQGNKRHVLFMHHGVRGAWMNDHIQNTTGLSVEAFKYFRTVLCGHYHKRHQVGPVSYIGSPYQTKADESGQDKGYAIWDGTKLEYVTTHWGKRYHRFDLKPGQELDLSAVAERDEVRVTTAAGIDPDAIGKVLAMAGIARHTVTPAVQVTEQRLDVDGDASMAQYAEAYVALQNEGADKHGAPTLDPKKLMSTFAEITQ